MKRSELKPGVVYAYQMSTYDKPQPMVVVDVKGGGNGWVMLNQRHRYAGKGTPNINGGLALFQQAAPAGPFRGILVAVVIPDDATRGTSGLHPAAGAKWSDDRVREARQQATLAEVQGLRIPAKGGSDLAIVGVVKYAVLDNARGLIGEWDTVTQAREDEAERRRIINADKAVEAGARVADTQRRVAALAAVGVTVPDASESLRYRYHHGANDWSPDEYIGNTGSVVLTLAQVDALLALIPPGTTTPTPIGDANVADDGWSYNQPDGHRPTAD